MGEQREHEHSSIGTPSSAQAASVLLDPLTAGQPYPGADGGSGGLARAVAIGAPIPARAFREVLAQVLNARGFEAVAAAGASEDPAGAEALRVASARDRAAWLLLESPALQQLATEIAGDIAARLGAPATVCVAEKFGASQGVCLAITSIDADGSRSIREKPADIDDDRSELDAAGLVALHARREVTDGEGGGGGGERLFCRAATKAGTGNRRLDDILRAIESGASYSFEDRSDGRVTVRIDRGGSAGRQISLLTRDEARTLQNALPPC